MNQPCQLPLCQQGRVQRIDGSTLEFYNHLYHHSGIKFMTPYQRHSGAAKVICQQRAEVYEAARQVNPKR